MIRTASLLLALAASAATSTTAPKKSIPWTPVGLSGGGAMFTPAVSPADPRLMLVNCDMSAAYLSRDGGRNWRMLSYDQLRSNTQCRPAFHPTDPKTVYAASGWEGLKVSRDGGSTWAFTGTGLPKNLQGEIAVSPEDPTFMLAGAEDAVYHSPDAGKTWTRCEGPEGTVLGFGFDRTSEARHTAFAATTKGIWGTEDGGETWADKTGGLPSKLVTSFAAGSNPKTKEKVLYCTLPRRDTAPASESGIYRSLDRGKTWQAVEGDGLNLETKAFDEWAMGPVANYSRLVTSDANPERVYAFNSNTGIPPPHHTSAYRSDDAGRTWRATFRADPRFPPTSAEPDYITANDGQYYQEVPLGGGRAPRTTPTS